MVSEAVFFAAAAGLVYLVGYTVMVPWWRNPVGRSMVSLVAAIELLLLPPVLRSLAGVDLRDPWFRWYYWASLHLVAFVMLWRLVVAYRVQRRG